MQRKIIDLNNPNIWVKIGLIITPALLLITVLEGGTRLLVWAFYGTPNHGMHWIFEYEPYLLTKTNKIAKSDGLYRDVSADSDSYRVVLIGGSTAAQVPNEVLENAFKTIADRKIEVINLGQGGYIINQERIMLLLHGIRLEPDLIISLDGLNDIVSTTKLGKVGLTYSNGFIAFAVRHPLINGVLSVFRKSQFVNAINKLYERKMEKAAQKDLELIKKTINHIEEGLRSIAIIAKGMNIPYIMSLQPYIHLRKNAPEIEKGLAWKYEYRKEFVSNTINAINNRLGKSSFPGEVYYVDATKAFDDSNHNYFVDEAHLTKKGNESLANYIVNAVKKDGFKIRRKREDQKLPSPQ